MLPRRVARRSLPAAGLVLALSVCTLGTSGAVTTTSAPAPGPSIIAAPVQVAPTSDGPVAYREIGHGAPTVVLVMGFAGSMDAWPPTFVDALARNNRVVIFNNAGIGQTAVPAAGITIPSMAQQTAALISALHLGKVDLIGWSMGTMIAQSLAVDHPGVVNRLVLAAPYPGTGTFTPASSAAGKSLSNISLADAATLLALLFPPGHSADGTAYAKGITSYPNFSVASPAIIQEQSAAEGTWIAGKDPEGHAVDHLKDPVLVADGSIDAIDPQANARQLAHVIPHAQLVFYPDASHGFIFQDQTAFVARVKAFFG